LHYTHFSADMQNWAFCQISNLQMRIYQLIQRKILLIHGNRHIWSCSLKSILGSKQDFWYLFCWEHVWRLVMVWLLLQYQVVWSGAASIRFYNDVYFMIPVSYHLNFSSRVTCTSKRELGLIICLSPQIYSKSWFYSRYHFFIFLFFVSAKLDVLVFGP
jgi:hypothetical protein